MRVLGWVACGRHGTRAKFLKPIAHLPLTGSAARNSEVDYNKFYAKLFAPLAAQIGPLDPEGIFHLMGFDGGGPLNFSTIGRGRDGPLTTYISCELAVREEQVPSDFGRYEFVCSCDDENWVRRNVSNLGRMSLQTAFGHGHTVDIGRVAGQDASIQGVLLQSECRLQIDGESYAILRVIGITRAEMEFKRSEGSDALVEALKLLDVYPHTLVHRASVV